MMSIPNTTLTSKQMTGSNCPTVGTGTSATSKPPTASTSRKPTTTATRNPTTRNQTVSTSPYNSDCANTSNTPTTISSTSATPDNPTNQTSQDTYPDTPSTPQRMLQTGEIAAIVVGGVAFLIIVTVIIVYSIILIRRKKCKKEPSQSVNSDGKRPSNSNVNSFDYYESVDSGCLNGAREDSFVYDTPARVEIPPDYMIKPIQTPKNKNKKTNGGQPNQTQCSRPGDNRVSLKPGANAFVIGSDITTVNGSVVTLMPENDSMNTSSSSDDIHKYYNEAAVNGWKTSDVGIEPQYSEVRVHAKAATPKPARVDSAEDGDLFLVDNNLYGQF